MEGNGEGQGVSEAGSGGTAAKPTTRNARAVSFLAYGIFTRPTSSIASQGHQHAVQPQRMFLLVARGRVLSLVHQPISAPVQRRR